MQRNEVQFLVKIRDAFLMAADATNEYIDSLAPPEAKEATTTPETVFQDLKFEQHNSQKLGNFETAFKPNNDEGKWTPAYDILKNSSATINARFHGKDYQFSYWLFSDKIFRQKMKPGA